VEYKEAVRLDPDDVNAHYTLGILLREQSRFAEAIAEYRHVVRIQPTHANAHYAMGVALRDSGNKREAIREFEEYLRLAPNTAANREWIAEARQIIKDLK
jgi:tetratricopeptide (TPR) repeat protein